MSEMQKLRLSKHVDLGGNDKNLQRIAEDRRELYYRGLLPGEDTVSIVADGEESPDDDAFKNTEFVLRLPAHGVNGDVPHKEHTRTSIGDCEDNFFFLKAFDESEVEKTCVVALATVDNIRETADDTIKQQLKDYMQKVFDLPKSKMEVLNGIAAAENSPELCLTCKVLHARALIPKDANGKSDPYCRLGILNQKHLDTELVKTKDLENWQKEGMVSEIMATSTKLATLNPDWNEEVELTVTNPREEILVIEIWDSDDEEVQQDMKIKGLKGFGHFIADLRKGVDDFMGRCFYPLHKIPVSGEERTFSIHSHSGKHKYGFISLSTNIRGIKADVPLEVSIWEHTMLTRALVNHSSRQKDSHYIHCWDGEIPTDGEKLLEQHALMNGLNELQLTAIRFSVLYKYHKVYVIKANTLRALLQKIKRHKGYLPTNFTLDQIKEAGHKSSDWLVQLFSDLMELANEILKNHLSIFYIKKSENVERIEDDLIILRELYSFQPFTHQLPPEKRNLKEVLENFIKEATPNWFHLQIANLEPQKKTEKTELNALRELCKDCLDLSQAILKKVSPLFMEDGVSYFTHFFTALDKLLGDEAEKQLKCKPSQELAHVTYEIHTDFRELSKLSKYLDKSVAAQLRMCQSHSWFKDMVEQWIKLVTDRCKERIKKAIHLNENLGVANVRISSSAVDTSGFLLQVGEFWKHLDWPDPIVAYALLATMVQRMCDCAQYYVGELYNSYEDHSDQDGHYMASDELSVALNNMHHIRTVVGQLPEQLKLQEFYNCLEGGTRAKDLVGKVLSNADEDFQNNMLLIVQDISVKYSPHIRKYIANAMKAPSDISDIDTIAPLLDYLTVNLQTLGDKTYSDVFSLILLPIWSVCIDAIRTSLRDLDYKKGTDVALLYQRLATLLDTLKEFFYADGQGLSDSQMDSDTYGELKADLNVLKLQSDDLTLRFLSDLVRLQEEKIKEGDMTLGKLLVSLQYDRDKSCLDVHVIQGKGLPAMDRDGLSDPYVQLTLLPRWIFVENSKKIHETQVVKSSLDPYFDREFLIPVSEEDMARKGTILLFTIFDYDMFTKNDFTGLCAVALDSIPWTPTPSTSQDKSATTGTRKNLILPLFVVSEDSNTPALLELVSRSVKGDSMASSFFKANKTILGNVEKLYREGSRTSL